MKARLVMILSMVLLLSLCACGGNGSADRDAGAPVNVHTAAIATETVVPAISATGTLEPRERIELAFKVAGVVARVSVDEGGTVRAGQSLAAIELREIDAAVERAQSAADKTERDLARARRLYADSVATLSQVQDAETAWNIAAADLETARFNRRYAEIVAPSAGVVLRRLAEPGELVAAGQPVIVLGSRARGSVVRVALSDRDAIRVKVGDAAEVRFGALPGRKFDGEVAELAAASDPLTGTYAAEISVEGAPHLSGLVAEAQIHPSNGGDHQLIPVESLLEADGTQATVFVLSPDGVHAERRRVTVGPMVGDRVIVLDGLQDRGAVITDGAAYINDGDSVRVLP